MIGLLNHLQWKLDFKLMVINRSPDYIIQPNKPQEQKKEMLKIVKSRDATVTARQDILIFHKRLGWYIAIFPISGSSKYQNTSLMDSLILRCAWIIIQNVSLSCHDPM